MWPVITTDARAAVPQHLREERGRRPFANRTADHCCAQPLLWLAERAQQGTYRGQRLRISDGTRRPNQPAQGRVIGFVQVHAPILAGHFPPAAQVHHSWEGPRE